MPLFSKMKLSKIEITHFKTNENKKELNLIKKDKDKKLLVNTKKDINIIMNNKDDNNAIINNKKDLQKKEIKRHENNDNSNESEYCLECKKKGNNISSIIVNILNKPFFCGLKS